MGQSIKAWVGLTAVIAVIAVAAIYLLVISPTKTSTANAREALASEQDTTIVLTKKLDSLKKQYAELDESLAELEALEVQIPTTAEMADYRRELLARATASGVTITSISTSTATAVSEAAPVAEPAEDAESSDSDTTEPSPSPSEDEAAAPAQTATTIAGQVLVGIPLQITVVGTYDAVRAFIASLQTTEGRLFVISGLGLVTQLDSPAAGGRPETVRGDVDAAIQGMLLALTPSQADATDPGDDPTASPSPSPAPLPSTERNPFVPVVSAAPAE